MNEDWPFKIPLSKGMFALVDEEDFALASQYKWSYGTHGYAMRAVSQLEGGGFQLLHNLILPDSGEPDHISGDKLDNRRGNLRPSTHQLNSFNRGKNKNNTSGYKGVTFVKRIGRWAAAIKMNGKRYHLGYFTDPKEGSDAYLKAAKKMVGQFAKI